MNDAIRSSKLLSSHNTVLHTNTHINNWNKSNTELWHWQQRCHACNKERSVHTWTRRQPMFHLQIQLPITMSIWLPNADNQKIINNHLNRFISNSLLMLIHRDLHHFDTTKHLRQEKEAKFPSQNHVQPFSFFFTKIQSDGASLQQVCQGMATSSDGPLRSSMTTTSTVCLLLWVQILCLSYLSIKAFLWLSWRAAKTFW